jgi:SAM-dependent methyltransferase
MDIQMIARLNVLWRSIYPYLAEWIGRWCPKGSGWILELGPFSGGISEALGAISRDLKPLCLTSQKEAARNLGTQFDSNLGVVIGSLEALPFETPFDMIISRGAFFFLTTEMIRETYRVLKPGASALLGGGYGPLTPPEEIAKIAEESKILNDRLGKKWISRAELEVMARDAGMEERGQILEEGGLWLLLRKDL